ncbi:unnamed protein product [Citrullus colocynthis]|uniref:Alpha/beta hydrolase fold-3 domain-containing protein n=1 Tax=Citrullus colocynthis TaxID=252529 RepID=A0ABP0XQI1_9ROSI
MLPLLIYTHDGAFLVGSIASLNYHCQLVSLATETNIITLSVKYRLAPEHPLLVSYDDVCAVVEWATSQSNHFDRVFVIGNNAKANVSYNMMGQARKSDHGPEGMKIIGLGLVHLLFMIDKLDKLIKYNFRTSAGLEDPRMNL